MKKKPSLFFGKNKNKPTDTIKNNTTNKNLFNKICKIGTTLFVVLNSQVFSNITQEEINKEIFNLLTKTTNFNKIVIQKNNTGTDTTDTNKKDTTIFLGQGQKESKEIVGEKGCRNITLEGYNPNDTIHINVPGPNDSVKITQNLNRISNPVWLSPRQEAFGGNSRIITTQGEGRWQLINAVFPFPYKRCYINVSFDILTNNENIEKEKGLITIYPNPTKDIVHINGIEGISQITIFDMQGKKILNQNTGGIIDMSNYKPGIYIIKITTSKGVITKKIIKE